MKNKITKVLLFTLLASLLVFAVCACGDECTHENLIELEEVAPTCTADGLTIGSKCADCGETIVAQEVAPATGHTEEVVPAVDATCTETGLTEGKKCSVCDEVLEAQEEIDALGHTEEDIPAVETTCTEAGSTAGVKCSVCDEVITEPTVVAAKGHTETVLPGKAATCTVAGLTDGKKCTVCNTVTVKQENIQALGHTPAAAVEENKIDATCTVDGSYDSVVYCSVCDAEISREEKTITAPGHTPAAAVEENKVDATCTVDGSYDSVVYCSVCDAEISRETKTIEAPGHTPAAAVEENRNEPDCVNKGSYESVVYCSVCDAEISREEKEIPANGHTPAEAVEENRDEPDCDTEGSYDLVVYCSVCNAEISRETKTIEALGHTEETIPEVAKTCTTAGATAGVKCSVCNAVLEEPEEIPASHEPVVLGAVAPECEKTGLTEGSKCSVCEEILVAQEVVAATGHTEKTLDAVAPKCEETGLTEGKQCSVCEKILVAQEEVAVLGHNYKLDESVLGNDGKPTCLTEGRWLYTCENGCGVPAYNLNDEETNVDARHGGYTEGDWETAPTCITPATYHCTGCGKDFSASVYPEIQGQATGTHVYDKLVEEKTASCTQFGYKLWACSNDDGCTATDVTDWAEKTAHTFEIGEDYSVVCNCGATYRNIAARVEEHRLCGDDCEGCATHSMKVVFVGASEDDEIELPGGETSTSPETDKQIVLIGLAGSDDTTYTITYKDAEGNAITSYTVEVAGEAHEFNLTTSTNGNVYIDISDVADQVKTIEIVSSADAVVSFYSVIE